MPETLLRHAQNSGTNTFVIDTGFVRPQFDACYVLTQRAPSRDRVAIIDTGTTHSVSRILETLEDISCTPEQVDFVILSHVHLDHAGGAGLLMQVCPHAQLVVHPRGVKHMLDPSALRAGAVAVYGESVIDRDYGQLLPIPAARIIPATDGLMINLAGRILTCWDTPGHAKHHITVWDPLTQGAFTGDTFGLSYREFDTAQGAFILPTTSPIHFDPKALRASLQRIMALQPRCLYLTHFGAVTGVAQLYEQMLDGIDFVENLGQSLRHAEQRHECLKSGLLQEYIQALRLQGCTLTDRQIEDILQIDVELNAQGLAVWLG